MFPFKKKHSGLCTMDLWNEDVTEESLRTEKDKYCPVCVQPAIEQVLGDIRKQEKSMSKFRVGDFWKTRGGEKVKILAVDKPGKSPLVVVDVSPDGYLSQLSPSGNLYDNQLSDFDLVAPWIDPAPKRQAWIKEVRNEYGYFHQVHFRDPVIKKTMVDDPYYERAPWLDEPTKQDFSKEKESLQKALECAPGTKMEDAIKLTLNSLIQMLEGLEK